MSRRTNKALYVRYGRDGRSKTTFYEIPLFPNGCRVNKCALPFVVTNDSVPRACIIYYRDHCRRDPQGRVSVDAGETAPGKRHVPEEKQAVGVPRAVGQRDQKKYARGSTPFFFFRFSRRNSVRDFNATRFHVAPYSYRRELRPGRPRWSHAIRAGRVRRKTEIRQQNQPENTLVRAGHARSRLEHR